MKRTANKWPISLTVELADNYFDGIEPYADDLKSTMMDGMVEQMVEQMADAFIKAKGNTMAMMEALKHQQQKS
ncbi:MAG: hypothetical protein K2H72_03145 [Muribaculaceae bacterium]|nr:hypothetical protein [Muribaculaceae bacterium]